ncbi:response regulator transcription factor [Paraclostridium sordellii]|uniref:response regulator transcription factor n=1 Tax=Paraclostridium sordellii TaxID=1505 RepID=UPI0005E1A827|nr:response regulator transcription factor [Paeniclostridium sordellii]QYE96568.1 response regulator transcription factor [Paeniclostridium sordellii]CEO09060.1 two component transcriptional regulator [[Clostridium] sordellii] [Paeniclostridium sordellii]CEP87428.1 two component transcriptional regulator [[Clostridium] sordellii] [Paeniclostridium sordellii]CEP95768.1 two component transcriptional regulator [[Clostridium] sordellii] [Paeniclostridium sordellii]CEP98891.1 two component transcri
MFTIMIIDDNEQLQIEIGNLLIANRYNIIKAKEFNNISKLIKEENPDLILLDINLPQDDGFKICTEVRSFSKVPIIFITSRNTNIDELMAITLGGDDFITKPYNTQILLARINSILKRAYPDDKNMDVVEHNDLKLNILSSTIEHNGNVCELTKNELKILHYMLMNKGKIVSRVDIMEHLWDSSLFVNNNTLTVNITRIRTKIEEIGVSDFIKTKRGQGYII